MAALDLKRVKCKSMGTRAMRSVTMMRVGVEGEKIESIIVVVVVVVVVVVECELREALVFDFILFY